MSALYTIGAILVVILFFNFMIFVHELGHFLAGKWRGAYIDRFQIWFGKPIWSKKLWGVQWGLGWIPAGGFVSLPQMESMEGIEGKATIPPEHRKPLKPLDKVIIAAAGPLFSLLLAYAFAVVVWGVGKPVGEVPGSTVGYVQPGSPAAEAGILPGDVITAIDGKAVDKWTGNMEGVRELIAMSEHEKIELTISRPGVAEPLVIRSSYKLPETKWWQRGGMRQLGLLPAAPAVVGGVLPGSPAERAGLRKGQTVSRVNGAPVFTPLAVQEACASGEELELVLESPGEAPATVRLRPELPTNWQGQAGAQAILGISWGDVIGEMKLERPSPQKQVNQSLKWMGSTLEKLFSSGSSVKMEHLSGPVGIGSYIYKMMGAENGVGWRLVLWFAVVLNVNLAVLNILPLPVVDGGHVTLGIIEMLRGKPVSGRFLDWIMSAFIFLLMAFFLFVTFKDVGDLVGGDKDPAEKLPAPVFTAPQ